MTRGALTHLSHSISDRVTRAQISYMYFQLQHLPHKTKPFVNFTILGQTDTHALELVLQEQSAVADLLPFEISSTTRRR